jgi:hypothetical protein
MHPAMGWPPLESCLLFVVNYHVRPLLRADHRRGKDHCRLRIGNLPEIPEREYLKACDKGANSGAA